jgi:hypothetical protein
MVQEYLADQFIVAVCQFFGNGFTGDFIGQE